jgi:hypothetical protein
VGPVSAGTIAVRGYLYHASLTARPAYHGGLGGTSTPAWTVALIAGIVVLTLVGAAWLVIIAFRQRPQHEDDDDANPGFGGGGSGRPPDGPCGPGSEPEWWPEFERQFAAHVEGLAERPALASR